MELTIFLSTLCLVFMFVCFDTIFHGKPKPIPRFKLKQVVLAPNGTTTIEAVIIKRQALARNEGYNWYYDVASYERDTDNRPRYRSTWSYTDELDMLENPCPENQALFKLPLGSDKVCQTCPQQLSCLAR